MNLGDKPNHKVRYQSTRNLGWGEGSIYLSPRESLSDSLMAWLRVHAS